MNRRQFIGSAITLPAALRGAPSKPNLLIIMTDQQRWSALSCAGNGILKTPNLDRLAREGVLYRNAMTPCPVCVPARTSILTGKSMQTTGVNSNNFAADVQKETRVSYVDA